MLDFLLSDAACPEIAIGALAGAVVLLFAWTLGVLSLGWVFQVNLAGRSVPSRVLGFAAASVLWLGATFVAIEQTVQISCLFPEL